MGKHSIPKSPRVTPRQMVTGALVATTAGSGLLIADTPAHADELPPVEVAEEISSPPAQIGPPVTLYVVQQDDWLAKIAPRYGMTATDLYWSNAGTIGPDWNLIHPGDRLIVSAQAAGQQSQPLAPAPTTEAQPMETASGFRAPLARLFLTQKFKGQAHRGVDWAAPIGTPGYAVADGYVVESGPASGFGLWTIVRSQIDGETVDFVYGHMDSLFVSVGQHVTAGEQVIVNGNNGVSTGPHLHFEVWIGGRYAGHPVDPQAWLASHGVSVG